MVKISIDIMQCNIYIYIYIFNCDVCLGQLILYLKIFMNIVHNYTYTCKCINYMVGIW